MLLTDLREVKSILQIDTCNDAENKVLSFYIEWASRLIEDYLDRQNVLEYQSRTEYYNGTGTQELLLKSRPVYTTPTIQVWEDSSSHFGSEADDFPSSSALTYGEDFFLVLDQTDTTVSRSGILVRRNKFWNKRNVRQGGYLSPFIGPNYGTIKVTYTGGYKVDDLPSDIRMAANMVVAKLRMVFPMGMVLNSESYEERAVSYVKYRNDLLGVVKPILFQYRNWKW